MVYLFSSPQVGGQNTASSAMRKVTSDETTYFSFGFSVLWGRFKSIIIEIRSWKSVQSLLITNFDVHLAPGEDGTALIKESKDSFTLRMGDLNLVFEERSAEKV